MRGRKEASLTGSTRRALAQQRPRLRRSACCLPAPTAAEQNEQCVTYWHGRFAHVLVDEYQDTNRTQYGT